MTNLLRKHSRKHSRKLHSNHKDHGRKSKTIFKKIIKNVQKKLGQEKCNAIIKSGKNKGHICNRINCSLHNLKYGFLNVAQTLNLPIPFRELVNDIHKYYFSVIEDETPNELLLLRKYGFYETESQIFISYEQIFDFFNSNIRIDPYDPENFKMFTYFIKKILQYVEFSDNLPERVLNFIIMYKFFDTKIARLFLKSNKKFEEIYILIKNKLTEIINTNINNFDTPTDIYFKDYLNEHFTPEGEFFEIARNKKIEKIAKTFEKTLTKKYKEVLESRYKPGGKGYLEAEKRFYLIANNLSKISELPMDVRHRIINKIKSKADPIRSRSSSK